MQRMTGFLFVAHLATFTLAAQQPPTPATPDEGRVDVGRTLYRKNGCFQCHGNEAQGGAAGPRLGPAPLPFTAFRNYVRRPTAEMPPYTAKVLSDRDLTDIHAFLRAQPTPPAANTLPLLRP